MPFSDGLGISGALPCAPTVARFYVKSLNRKLKHGYGTQAFIRCDIDKGRFSVLPASPALMNMPEQMQHRRDLLNPEQQFLAACPLRHPAWIIPDAERRTMRNQDVGIVGDERPFRGKRLATRQVERPVVECRCPGAAIKTDAF